MRRECFLPLISKHELISPFAEQPEDVLRDGPGMVSLILLLSV